MEELIIDILFVGLLIIPLILNGFKNLTEFFVKSYNKSLAQSKHFIMTLPICVYLIYDLSAKSNSPAIIGLTVSLGLFFYFYACAISFLIMQAGTYNK